MHNMFSCNHTFLLFILIIAIESYIVQAKRKKEIVTQQKSKSKKLKGADPSEQIMVSSVTGEDNLLLHVGVCM